MIVRDYATILAQIDQIFEEIDVKPRQVAIEAVEQPGDVEQQHRQVEHVNRVHAGLDRAFLAR